MKHKLVFIALLFSFALFVAPNANAQWVKTSCPYASYVNCFAAIGTNLFVGTQLSGIFLSTDSGLSWLADSSGLPVSSDYCPVQSIAASGSILFAGIDNVNGGGVYRSTDNGSTWVAANAGITNQVVYALAVSDTNLFAATGSDIFLSTNDGNSWKAVDNGLPTNQYVYSLALIGNILFTGTGKIDSGSVFRSTNNGASWEPANFGLPNYLGPVFALAVSGSDILAGPGNSEINTGDVFLSTNNGSNWTEVSNGLPSYSISLVSALVVSGGNIFAGILGGGVYMTAFNGTSWTSVNLGLSDSNVFSLTSFGGFLFAGTDSGVFRRSLSDFNPSGVVENAFSNSTSTLCIFPNPATSSITVESANGPVSILDPLGRSYTTPQPPPWKGGGVMIDISTLPAGVYFVSDGYSRSKFVKQ